jgi:protein TonB
MTAEALASRGPLWPQPQDADDQALPLWQAVLVAAVVEVLVPVLVFGVDWSFLHLWNEPPPTPVMSVRLDEPLAQRPPEPPPPKQQTKPKLPEPPKPFKQVDIERPKPVANEALANIELPKPEPKPKPKPKPPEEQRTPEPEPEAPPLPSVFRDVKPVRKVKPVYPPEAEAQHIQGHVKVRLSVDLEGEVTAAEVLVSDPPGVFEEAVLTAVKQYKFKKDGTTYQADQDVVFKIDD